MWTKSIAVMVPADFVTSRRMLRGIKHRAERPAAATDVAGRFAGAAGAVMGAGIGAIVRNTGGAVTAVVLILIIAPPLIVQLVSDAGSWVPTPLAVALSGVTPQAAGVGPGRHSGGSARPRRVGRGARGDRSRVGPATGHRVMRPSPVTGR